MPLERAILASGFSTGLSRRKWTAGSYFVSVLLEKWLDFKAGEHAV
jgi:hypothetical protein